MMWLRLGTRAAIAGIVGTTLALADAGCSGGSGGGSSGDAGSSSGSSGSGSGSGSSSGSASSGSGSSSGLSHGDAGNEAGSSSGGSGSSSGGHPVPGACMQTCDNGTPNGETGCNPCMQSNCPTEYAACQADNQSGCVSCAALLAGGGSGFSCPNTDTLAGNLLTCACKSTTCY
jgi:hypothetical protein